MKIFLSSLVILFASFSVNAAEDVTVITARDNIYVLVSPSGGNVTVSTGEDGTFLIDDQLVERSERIQATVKEITDQNIKFILNTHYHFDHSGGNEFFGEKDAIIVAHDNVRKRLSTKQFITFFKKEIPPMAKVGLPTVTLTNNMALHYNNDNIRLIHTPTAHTDGDTIAHFTKSNVIVAGDLIFNGMYPFIDTEHGGSIKGVVAGADVMLNIANSETIIVPGHGPIMNKSDLQEYRKTLNTISKKVEGAIKEGKTLQQIIEQKPTQPFDGQWGGGFISPDAFVTIVYESFQ